jgi:hypothetical protein
LPFASTVPGNGVAQCLEARAGCLPHAFVALCTLTGHVNMARTLGDRML